MYMFVCSYCGPAVIYIDHENCLRSMAKIWNSRSKSGAYVCGLKMLLQDLQISSATIFTPGILKGNVAVYKVLNIEKRHNYVS